MTISNPSSGPELFEVGSIVDINPPSAATWGDVDLSAVVPVGTKYVTILFGVIGSGLTLQVGARENGSSLNTIKQMLTATALSLTVRVDANRIIELYEQDVTYVVSFVFSYWK